MNDLLARRRLRGNLIDMTAGNEQDVSRLEAAALTVDGAGRLALSGLLLKIGEPTPPPPGHVLIYAEESAGVVYLRAMDAAGVVKTLESW